MLELFFAGTGIYMLISGRLPRGMFRALFGRGEYQISSGRARLWGLFLMSPIPVVLLVVTCLVLNQSFEMSTLLMVEILYLFIVGIASIVIARGCRRPEQVAGQLAAQSSSMPEQSSQTTPSQFTQGSVPPEQPAPGSSRSYGARVAIIIGVVVLSCIALGGISTFCMTIFPTLVYGSGKSDNVLLDIIFLALLFVIPVLSGFGAYKLIRMLKK